MRVLATKGGVLIDDPDDGSGRRGLSRRQSIFFSND
jgi:hypothetical protein